MSDQPPESVGETQTVTPEEFSHGVSTVGIVMALLGGYGYLILGSSASTSTRGAAAMSLLISFLGVYLIGFAGWVRWKHRQQASGSV